MQQGSCFSRNVKDASTLSVEVSYVAVGRVVGEIRGQTRL